MNDVRVFGQCHSCDQTTTFTSDIQQLRNLVGSNCLHIESAEHVGCLKPSTPYTQGPDPDDSPVPCGKCVLCLMNNKLYDLKEENDNLRELLRDYGH